MHIQCGQWEEKGLLVDLSQQVVTPTPSIPELLGFRLRTGLPVSVPFALL